MTFLCGSRWEVYSNVLPSLLSGQAMTLTSMADEWESPGSSSMAAASPMATAKACPSNPDSGYLALKTPGVRFFRG